MTSLLTRISTINFLMRRIRIGEGPSPILIPPKREFKVISVVSTRLSVIVINVIY